jgi:hypothetical protein
MTAHQWLKSEAKYGRNVLHAGLEGSRSGREAFLNGRPLTPYLNKSVCKALIPTAIGSCIGVLGGVTQRNRSAGRILAAASIGGAIGFAVGIAWENRGLTRSAVRGAAQQIVKVRDEHWFERNPIAYA